MWFEIKRVYICPTDHRPLVRVDVHYIIGTAVKQVLLVRLCAAAVSEIQYYFIVDACNLKLFKVVGSTQWVLYIVKDTILLKKYTIK